MLNKDIEKIIENSSFLKASKEVAAFRNANKDKEILSLGIGDVSTPIIKPIIEAMHKAVDDLADMNTFKGYGAYYGIDSLREIILENEYKEYDFTKEEIFISDGVKSDAGNILELFDDNIKILISNPEYPIYFNSATLLHKNIEIINLNNEFKTPIPNKHVDVIYLCSPNNPTGVAYNYDDLKAWIDYCLKENAYLIFDNVYHCFIRDNNIPNSIYEIEGSKKCAIELRSFSKKASFTGLRVSYYVIPKEIDNHLWQERTINRFNGASYIAQKGAEAYYLKESQDIIKENIKRYHENIDYLKDSFLKMNYEVIGGDNAPFIWVKIKNKMKSWDFFRYILKEINVVIVPGIIFGNNGDDYFRISGLGTIENSKKAIKRFESLNEKNS